ncbi:hydroxymethylpyrimidine/phosphomethylpyrimidine kinase [Virgisporangium aliadipatigenens]|uniref:Hydroxymethylpyrimidine/phosphomethylpyrimidine kinase n=1 Tax=Virgisporangium aliadipatigenens TaxID=741659 RepID=A0A8J3YQM6_9ACTN|nr:bifunctional hydroxymethylpyrimidine kinase/phosphomethylpyrimidine kinase [Virgisporangium aliadipatigenens]GIJ49889.1 hydroxymethylpyrimidine/phosphomethylpyrimidine kinase [Virgisporangium aliadipatigenens]
MEQPVVALTVAGSDSGGGAGVQADLKAFAMCGVFGASVFTALTAQNTMGVKGIHAVPRDFVAAQLDAVLADLPVGAVKTGMLASASTVELVAEYAPRLPNLVVDPVLVASSGDRLFTDSVEQAYLTALFPHAAVITPNMREASVLTGREVSTVDDMRAAAERLGETGAKCVVVKGGHLSDSSAVDVVWRDGTVDLVEAPWVETRNNHGTGCTFAAVTAARLARGADPKSAIFGAKAYVHEAIRASADWRLGGGHGPLGWKPMP